MITTILACTVAPWAVAAGFALWFIHRAVQTLAPTPENPDRAPRDRAAALYLPPSWRAEV